MAPCGEGRPALFTHRTPCKGSRPPEPMAAQGKTGRRLFSNLSYMHVLPVTTVSQLGLLGATPNESPRISPWADVKLTVQAGLEVGEMGAFGEGGGRFLEAESAAERKAHRTGVQKDPERHTPPHTSHHVQM